jgi:hypothetical protein
MGFLPSSSTIQLYAYFTQYARDKILNGNVVDFKVRQFTLHDEDINYGLSKEIVGTDSSGNTLYNTLTSGFIPDITGDNDACIKSVSNAYYLINNMLTGTTQIQTPVLGCTDLTATNYNPLATQNDGSCTYGPPPSRTLTIGFDQASYNEPPPADQSKLHNYTVNVNLKALAGDTTGNANLQEALGTTFNIEIIDYDSSLIQNVTTTPLNPKGFSLGNTTSFNLQFGKKSLVVLDPFLVETVTVKLRLVPLQSNRIIEPGKDIFTYTKLIRWNKT